jgi:lysophospholipase L1-like esterase
LPDHTLHNYGLAGDTVLSLYRRIRRFNLYRPVDMACVWIGVNDVLAFTHPIIPVFKRLTGQIPTPDPASFGERYRALLDLLHPLAGRLVVVSPWLVGEDPGNRWNRQLDDLCVIIRDLTAGYDQARFLDLRGRAVAALDGKPVPPYVPGRLYRTVRDALVLRTPDEVDRVAATRGFHLTLDGVHLNSAGAELVAGAFVEAITE